MDLTRELTEAKTKVDQAVAKFERDKQFHLLRNDGTPRYVPDEMAEREAEYLKPLQTTIESAISVAQAAQQTAQSWQEDAAHGDGTAILTDLELHRARAAADFAKEDVGSLDFAGLVGRVQTGLRTTDRASAWLTLRYGRARRQELWLAMKAPTPGDRERFASLDEDLAVLAGCLQDVKVSANAASADGLLSAARDLDIYARSAWDTASGESQRRLDAKRRAGGY